MSYVLEHQYPTRQVLGKTLISQQWLTPPQLVSAIAEQEEPNQKLGDTLVLSRLLSEMRPTFTLSQQVGSTITGERVGLDPRDLTNLRKTL